MCLETRNGQTTQRWFSPSPKRRHLPLGVLRRTPAFREKLPAGTIPSTAQLTAHLLVLGFELADHSLGLVVEGGEDLVGVLFRVVKSQAADREIDDFMTVPRSRPG